MHYNLRSVDHLKILFYTFFVSDTKVGPGDEAVNKIRYSPYSNRAFSGVKKTYMNFFLKKS